MSVPSGVRLALVALLSLAAACGPGRVGGAAPVSAEPPPAPAPVAARPERLLAAPPVEPTEQYVQLASTAARDTELAPFTATFTSWPIVGRITSPFGPRWGGFHNGLDIAGTFNAPVRASAAGQVVVAGKPYLAWGDTATIVIIAHGSDLATVYVHLSDERPPIVRAGQRVSAGEVIAYNGSTGWSTGPHVHFMVVVSGRAVDPIPYLPSL